MYVADNIKPHLVKPSTSSGPVHQKLSIKDLEGTLVTLFIQLSCLHPVNVRIASCITISDYSILTFTRIYWILGYDPSEMVGLRAYQYFHPEDLTATSSCHMNCETQCVCGCVCGCVWVCVCMGVCGCGCV